MAEKTYRFEVFDAIFITALICAIIGLIYTLRNSFLLIATLMSVLIIFALMVLGGRLGAPFYLEKVIVSILLKNNGRMKLDKLKSKYNSSSFDEILRRLEDRNNIKIDSGTVKLNEEQIKKGLRNFIMMWRIERIINR